MAQVSMKEIVREVDGPELSDIDLVARILDLRQEKARVSDACKNAQETLVERLVERGVTEAEIGDHLITISLKLLTQYDSATLKSLKNCAVGEDDLWMVITQSPSTKQLQALSDKTGAAGKAVIASAKRKIDTETTLLKIKKPSKKRKRF
jgi:hypothetical protein